MSTEQDPRSERLFLPSASSFESTALCPGREQLLATLPAETIIGKPNEAAETGTRIHKARETGKTDELSEEELAIFNRGMENEKRIVADWCQKFNISNFAEQPPETRLFLNWEETMEPAASAQLDVHFTAGAHVLSIDWKTLWNPWLTPAERNYQGRLQAVLAAREYDAKHVRMAFNRAMFGTSDVVDYGEQDLAYAEASIFQSLWESKQPGAPRHAGMWCRYCQAKAVCAEAGAFAMLPSRVPVAGMSSTADVTALVETMTPDDLVAIFKKSSVIDKILDAVKFRLKGMSAEELQVLGLGKKPGRKLDPITNPLQAYLLLKREGVPEADMWAALNFSKPKLVEAVWKSKAGMTKKQLELWLFSQMLEPYIEKQTADSSLEIL